MSDYNGWSNRETWLVNVWFNPESKDDLECAKEFLEEAYDELPDVMKDFCAIHMIDWDELKENVASDETDNEGEDNE